MQEGGELIPSYFHFFFKISWFAREEAESWCPPNHPHLFLLEFCGREKERKKSQKRRGGGGGLSLSKCLPFPSVSSGQGRKEGLKGRQGGRKKRTKFLF